MYRLAALALLATSVAAKDGCPSTSLTLEDWVSLIGMTPTREALCGDGLFASFGLPRFCHSNIVDVD